MDINTLTAVARNQSVVLGKLVTLHPNTATSSSLPLEPPEEVFKNIFTFLVIHHSC